MDESGLLHYIHVDLAATNVTPLSPIHTEYRQYHRNIALTHCKLNKETVIRNLLSEIVPFHFLRLFCIATMRCYESTYTHP